MAYIKNTSNLKIVKTRNKGLSLARGKYIAIMDADDVSLPERFERQVRFLDAHDDVGLGPAISSRHWLIDRKKASCLG